MMLNISAASIDTPGLYIYISFQMIHKNNAVKESYCRIYVNVFKQVCCVIMNVT